MSVRFADSDISLLASCELTVFATRASARHVDDPRATEPPACDSLRLAKRPGAGTPAQPWNVVDDVDHVMNANTFPHLAVQLTGSRDSSFGMGSLGLAVGKQVYDRVVKHGRGHIMPDSLTT